MPQQCAAHQKDEREMKALIEQLRNALMGHTELVEAVFVGIVALGFLRVSLTAWKDVIKLDRESYNIRDRVLQPMIDKVQPRDAIAIRKLRLELTQAGLRNEHAIEQYTMMRIIGLGAAFVLTFFFAIFRADVLSTVVFAGMSMYLAYAFPDYYIARRAKARQALIARALPTLTDLMVLCLDVGLSIESSFERVSLEMRSMEPLMADEASIMLSEMSSGLTFAPALRRMAERIGLEELMILSRLISQASLLGASVAQALREYSEASHAKRMMSLEEQAGKISSMLTLPLTVCLLPASMIVLLGPAIIMLVRAFTRV